MLNDDAKYGLDGLVTHFPPGTRPFAHGDELVDHIGERVDDVEGKKLGHAHAVLVMRHDGRTRFLLVRSRNGQQRAVPTEGAVTGAGRIWVPWPRSTIERGPHLAAHGVLGARTEQEICRVFGLNPGPAVRNAAWERRATVSRAMRSADDPRTIEWVPGPRPGGGAPRFA